MTNKTTSAGIWLTNSTLMVVFFLLSGCIETTSPPVVPEISYSSNQSGFCNDSFGNENKCIDLTFHLEDGDGNVGLSEADTISPFVGVFRNNFYYDLFVKKENGFEKYEELVANYFRIPFIEPQGQNKFLIADVTVQLRFFSQILIYDTLYLEFFVYDRELNRSNLEQSDTIIFEQQDL